MEDKDKIRELENDILNEKAFVEKEKRIILEKESVEKKNLENNIINEKRVIIEKEKAVGSYSESNLIEERKRKVLGFFKNNPTIIFAGILILLVIFGVFIRVQPMTDHNGRPGLWDITTNTWTLGPDLDPFLFLRYAKEMVANGHIDTWDSMRNVPLGFDTSMELQMVSYMIVLTYKLVNLFGTYNVDFAGVLMPVLFFALITIAFFLFVRELFVREDDEKSKFRAGIIASISTLFMIVIPEFLSRTVAGIPEKESIGFFFMFLAFYLFIKAWKTKNTILSSLLGVLAGVATGLMGLTWGGVVYIYVAIALASLAALMINKIDKKETLVYSLWLISAIIVTFMFTNRYSVTGFVTSLDSGLATFVFALIIVHFTLWKTKVKELRIWESIRVPETIISIIVTILLGLIAISIIFGPSFILDKASAVNKIFFNPVTGRWSTTVAENRQPYFTEWSAGFGPVIGNLPILFWLFIAGSIVLFRKMMNKIKNVDAWVLTGAYVLFLFSLIFSRYSSSGMFNGENFISKFAYYVSGLILAGALIYYYVKYYRENDKSFELVEFEYIFLFALFILCLFTARSAVRLIMVLAPIAPIFVAFLIVWLAVKFKNEKSSNNKVIVGIIVVVIILLSLYAAINFYSNVKNRAYYNAPYDYTFQWQKAMDWVRTSTPADAVFAHWWDYGYWVQSIGNRATVTDGGNVIVWWNYLTGRLVLTGDNQKDALNFLYAHNTTHLLIDSSDIGKYGAFSQIGSDENFDRLSQGPVTLLSDAKQIQETKNEIIRNYNIPAGNGRISLVGLEEDLTFEINGTKTTLFKENTGLMGINIRYSQYNDTIEFKQPEAIFLDQSQGKQHVVPMRYLEYNGKFKDFGKGINATAYIIQQVYSSGQGLQLDNMGAMIYLSPRIMRGMLGQVYVLNDPLKKWGAFKLVHSEPDFILSQISAQGVNLGEFTYYQGLRGPIKIWNITYTGKEEVKEEYLIKSPPSYITWSF
jgi:asparagine N-glycosylation enzyme membrane subunit Stt3